MLLQQRSLDIVQGIELVQDVQEQLKDLREEIDDWHGIWFHSAVDIVQEVRTEKLSIPHRCNKQTQRANVKADEPEVYYQRSLTIPFLDHLIKELEERFSSNAKINVATSGLCLVPSVVLKRDDWQSSVKDLAPLYKADLPAPLSIATELHCWKRKFMHYGSNKLPDTLIDALNERDISTLLKILSIIPVTSCEAEQTFSALRRVKPFLRTTMTEDRLSTWSYTAAYTCTSKYYDRLR